MRFRISRFASTWMICALLETTPRAESGSRGMRTDLAGHDGVCRTVPDFADRPAISSTQILDELEVIRPQVQIELDANLQLGGVIVVLLPVHPPKVGILGGRGRLWGRRSQSESLDILALHGARGEGGVGH